MKTLTSTSKNVFACSLLLFTLAACNSNKSSNESSDSEPVQTPSAPLISAGLDTIYGDETVLATVNGSRIGEQDLSVNLVRTLGDSYAQITDTGVEEKVLESMIASRAIAMKSLAAMSEDEQAILNKRVAQFREELLVKQYLVEHAEPQSISAVQIEQYYEDNAEEFAGKKERLYEVLTTDPVHYKQNPSGSLQSINQAKTHDNWRTLATDSQQNEYPLTHSFITMVGDSAQGVIEEAVLKLNAGEISRVVISDGAPYLAKLVETTEHPPTSLAEAKSEIRKRLLPATIKESVRAISKAVLAESDVVLSQASD